MTDLGLDEQAVAFAGDLTTTVRTIAPDASPFVATVLEGDRRQRFAVSQSPNTGIPLLVQGQALLTLKVDYRCCLDGHDRYLAVDESFIKVFEGPKAGGEPLFRYEYTRETDDGVPASHLQMHAHRDALTYVMTRCGDTTRRARRRLDAGGVPHMYELHFPLGGHRFRPCLEDVLEMLITALGVDHPREAREALRAGRGRWRRTQTRSVVRDAPDEAASVLRDLGYDVHFNSSGRALPVEKTVRLEDY